MLGYATMVRCEVPHVVSTVGGKVSTVGSLTRGNMWEGLQSVPPVNGFACAERHHLESMDAPNATAAVRD